MILTLLLSILGLIDSIYLTWEHYNRIIPPCTIHPFLPSFLIDCGKVLTSPYSTMSGIPLALFGIIHYTILSILFFKSIFSNNKIYRYLAILQTITGAIASLFFMYIQIGIIGSICLYCTLSAIISFAILIIVYKLLKKERYELHLFFYGIIYQTLIKPVFFLIDPEVIHNFMVWLGNLLGQTPIIKFIGSKFIFKNKSLKQKVAGITFSNPIGLAAGFDYNAQLTKTLYYLGFGFQTVGTVTNLPYEGNPPPRLGRLIKSKSLMVNKGFKNKGADFISQELTNLQSKIPTGVSIGITNSNKLKTVYEGVEDIINAFKTFEKKRINNSYYELNVSCPNLIHTKKINFYSSKNLSYLLTAVNQLRIKKPIFVKLPIEKNNREITNILNIIINNKKIKGVIIGNLQKNKNDLSLIPSEVKKFKNGYFSGKPCEKRSNELIKLTYKKYKDRLIIIGCGGIFSAKDAYKKIKLGASLVQLITGMIFQGPQLISQINLELIDLLKKDGFKNIKNAIGKNI